MSSVHETAYPRLKEEFSEQELVAIYTPAPAELKFVAARYRQVTLQTFLLIQLKLLQRLGYFVALATIPVEIVKHICSRAQVRVPTKSALARYDKSGTKHRHRAHLRDFVGIRELTETDEAWLQGQALQAAQTKQELADIINVLIEELVQRRFELPSYTDLYRMSSNARATVNERIYKSVTGPLSEAVIARLDGLFKPVAGRSLWDSLKREPKQPNVREVTDFLSHIDSMMALSKDLPDTSHIAATKREQLVLEARALDLAEMRAMKPLKRHTLAVLLVQTQLQKAMDDIAEIFVKTVRNMHSVAEDRPRQYHLQQAEQVERLIGQFRDVLTVFSEEGTSDQRVARVETVLDGDAEGWIGACDEHMAYAGNNYFPFMLNSYTGKRSLLFKCLEALELRSSSQDVSLLRAIAQVQKFRTSHKEHISVTESGIDVADHDWMADKWRDLFGRRQNVEQSAYHRKYYELAVFSEVMIALKSGDLFVEHSGDYDDYRNHLVSWDEYEAEVQGYSEMVGLPVEPKEFVVKLRREMKELAREVDRSFPENSGVDIDDSGLIIRRPERLKPPAELEMVDEAIRAQLPEASILDVLTEVEKWLDLHRLFGPLSGFETKVDDPRKRFITTLFCYGCNLGPTQTARSVKSLSRKQVAWLNLKHVTEQKLDKAIFKVINAYTRSPAPPSRPVAPGWISPCCRARPSTRRAILPAHAAPLPSPCERRSPPD